MPAFWEAPRRAGCASRSSIRASSACRLRRVANFPTSRRQPAWAPPTARARRPARASPRPAECRDAFGCRNAGRPVERDRRPGLPDRDRRYGGNARRPRCPDRRGSAETSPRLRYAHGGFRRNRHGLAGGKSPANGSRGDTVDSWRDKVSVPGWRSSIDASRCLAAAHIRSVARLAGHPAGGRRQLSAAGNRRRVMLAQAETGGATWTLAAAPTTAALSNGIAALVEPDMWRRLAGRVAAYDTRGARLDTIAPQRIVLAATQPFSFTGWRLIPPTGCRPTSCSSPCSSSPPSRCLVSSPRSLLRGLGRRTDAAVPFTSPLQGRPSLQAPPRTVFLPSGRWS